MALLRLLAEPTKEQDQPAAPKLRLLKDPADTPAVKSLSPADMPDPFQDPTHPDSSAKIDADLQDTFKQMADYYGVKDPKETQKEEFDQTLNNMDRQNAAEKLKELTQAAFIENGKSKILNPEDMAKDAVRQAARSVIPAVSPVSPTIIPKSERESALDREFAPHAIDAAVVAGLAAHGNVPALISYGAFRATEEGLKKLPKASETEKGKSIIEKMPESPLAGLGIAGLQAKIPTKKAMDLIQEGAKFGASVKAGQLASGKWLEGMKYIKSFVPEAAINAIEKKLYTKAAEIHGANIDNVMPKPVAREMAETLYAAMMKGGKVGGTEWAAGTLPENIAKDITKNVYKKAMSGIATKLFKGQSTAFGAGLPIPEGAFDEAANLFKIAPEVAPEVAAAQKVAIPAEVLNRAKNIVNLYESGQLGKGPQNDKAYEQSKKIIEKSNIENVSGVSPETAKTFKVNESLFDNKIAARSHAGTSFSPDKRAAQEKDSYREGIQSAYDELLGLAKSPAQKDLLLKEMEDFQRGYAQRKNSLMSSHGNLVSSMIAGPSNFPAARMNKRNESYMNKVNEFLEWQKRAKSSMAKKIKDLGVQEAGGADVVLQQDIDKMIALHEKMKAVNVIVKKKNLTPEEKIAQITPLIGAKNAAAILQPDFAGRVGFPQYQLTSNTSKIKRMKESLEKMKAADLASGKDTIGEYEGVQIVKNNDINRLQLVFDKTPEEGIRKELVGSGWHWSPKNKAWQRMITDRSEFSAKKILDKNYSKKGSLPPAGPDVAPTTIPVKSDTGEISVKQEEAPEKVEPKDLTQKKYVESVKSSTDLKPEEIANAHEIMVKDAVEKGETVPEEILKDYPDLHKMKQGEALAEQRRAIYKKSLDKANIGRTLTDDEKFAQDFILKNPDKAMDNYINEALREFEADNIISADIGKFAIPDMHVNKSITYHEAGSALKDARTEELLADITTADKPIAFTAGGSGAGKSYTLKEVNKTESLKEGYALIHDTNLNSIGSAKRKIKEALETGRPVEILVVYRDPVDAWEHGVIPRIATEDRAVPILSHLETHLGYQPVIHEIAKEFPKTQVGIKVLINAMHKAPKIVPLDLMPKIGYTKSELKEKLYNIAKSYYEQGKINETAFREILKGSPDLESRASEEGVIEDAVPRTAPERGQSLVEKPEVKPEPITKKPTEHQTLGGLVAGRGGISPESIVANGYDLKMWRENNLGHLIKKDGMALDELADELSNSGILQVPYERNASDYLVQQLENKMSLRQGPTKKEEQEQFKKEKEAEEARKAEAAKAKELDEMFEELSLKSPEEFLTEQARAEALEKINPPTGRGGIVPPELEFGKWKDRGAFSLARETMERNIERVAGPDAGKVKEFLSEPIAKNETDRVEFMNKTRRDIKDFMKVLDIKTGSLDDKLMQRFGEGRMTLDELKGSTKNWAKVEQGARYFRNVYDDLLDKINAVRDKFGYRPIPKRPDYFRHYQEMGSFISSFGILTKAEDLPTEIAGMTHIFKPTKPFSTIELKRMGGKFTESAIGGIDNYLEAMSKQLYHLDSMARARVLEKYIRNVGKLGEADLPNFVANLSEYANLLSGKKALLDRGFENYFGRRGYTVMNWLRRRTSLNMVAGNIGSALTNFIPFTQAMATTKKIPALRGLFEATISPFKERFADIEGQMSSLLLRRYPEKSLNMSNMDKAADMISFLFNAVDRFAAKAIVSGKFYEGLAQKLSPEEAMKRADDYAARVIADRSWGQLPNLFSAKTVGFITQFQVEVNNMMSFIAHDIPQQYKKNAYKTAGALFQFMLYSYLYNEASQQVTGRRPTIDPIYALLIMAGKTEHRAKPQKKRNFDAVMSIIDNMPFTNIFSSGGRFPISAGFPDLKKLAMGESTMRKEWTKPLYYFASPFGGGQVRKTVEGIQDFKKGRSETPTGKVRYQIRKSPANMLRMALFGKYASPEARRYYNSGASPKGKGSSGSGSGSLRLLK